jgi:RNA polymerase sigma-70 factor (ECF subfamily)
MIATMQPEMRGHELEASFLDIYDRHAPTVLGYLRIAVGERDAEDLCSECFCSAWSAWARYKGVRSDTLPWLMRIARNRVIDRSRRLSAHPMDSLERHPNVPGPGPVDPVDRLHLEAALSRLSKDDRELLALRAAGLTHAEIGQLQKRREGAVKTAWVRALGRIRPYLEVGS